jgi:hypothetical protein
LPACLRDSKPQCCIKNAHPCPVQAGWKAAAANSSKKQDKEADLKEAGNVVNFDGGHGVGWYSGTKRDSDKKNFQGWPVFCY